MMNASVDRLRWKLTLWYVAVFTGVMLLFGAAIYAVYNRETEQGLNRSLERTAEIQTRWVLERTRPRNVSVAFSEQDTITLERSVYVFSATRRKGCKDCPSFWSLEPISPKQAESWVRRTAPH